MSCPNPTPQHTVVLCALFSRTRSSSCVAEVLIRILCSVGVQPHCVVSHHGPVLVPMFGVNLVSRCVHSCERSCSCALRNVSVQFPTFLHCWIVCLRNSLFLCDCINTDYQTLLFASLLVHSLSEHGSADTQDGSSEVSTSLSCLGGIHHRSHVYIIQHYVKGTILTGLKFS